MTLSSPAKRSPAQLAADVRAIWQAGVEGVRSDRLVRENIVVDGDYLLIGDEELDLAAIRHIKVVGAGKAGAGMARGFEQALGPKLLREKQVGGWLNVPADCVEPLETITLHAGRPAGKNEPTPEGVFGSQSILEIAGKCGENDLLLVLISGGGSALLPAPVDAISLADKLALTKHLSASGANIKQLNIVRSQLSEIKSGGLVRHSRAGRIISLIISDVMGDPIDLISSGPTCMGSATPRDALAILETFHALDIAPQATHYLREKQLKVSTAPQHREDDRVTNLVIGNLAVAVDSAGVEAEKRGYSHTMHVARELEGAAEEVGRYHAAQARYMCDTPGSDCLITGGEPTVSLPPEGARGIGGRNQQLILAAAADLDLSYAARVAMISGGTDGEDGPTNAAGGVLDETSLTKLLADRAAIDRALARCDAYPLLAASQGLVITGPTHTNVCDLRVVVVDRIQPQPHK